MLIVKYNVNSIFKISIKNFIAKNKNIISARIWTWNFPAFSEQACYLRLFSF